VSGSVAVTGVGMMTALGLDTESSWDQLINGVNPVAPFTDSKAKELDCSFGFSLPEGAEEVFRTTIQKRKRRQMTRATMIAVVTAAMALKDSAYPLSESNTERVGVVAGATGTGYAPQNTDRAIDEHRILKNMASASAAWIAILNKITGPSFVTSTACSSGTFALHGACSLIASGECDMVIAGSADSCLSFLDIQGFCSLMALSDKNDAYRTACRPFDRNRSGFVMGEGGGMLVLESMESAKKRGARIYATLHTPGLVSEAYNIISPEPRGQGMIRAMQKALHNSGLQPHDIDYVNAHGTATALNDPFEAAAIAAVFEKTAQRLPVSSTKAQTGHCLSGAAGIEAVLCCKAIEQGVIPATLNCEHPFDDCPVNIVCDQPLHREVRHVMSNSFAFGGQNGVCIFSKAD